MQTRHLFFLIHSQLFHQCLEDLACIWCSINNCRMDSERAGCARKGVTGNLSSFLEQVLLKLRIHWGGEELRETKQEEPHTKRLEEGQMGSNTEGREGGKRAAMCLEHMGPDRVFCNDGLHHSEVT